MSDELTVDEVFADTCVLLNFVQREWESTQSVEFVESDRIEIVVSDAVLDELESVSERREDIYEDVIDFLLERDDGVEEYDPRERHVYIGANDASHVRDIQMKLATLDDMREVLRRLRRYLRAAQRRLEFLQNELEDHVVTPNGSITLEFAVQGVIDNDDDATIVTDAAGWAADGGSGILVTLDSEDLLDHEADLANLLRKEQGPDWIITIHPPEAVLSDAPLETE
jgi:predicted nucleic acid-binding protein